MHTVIVDDQLTFFMNVSDSSFTICLIRLSAQVAYRSHRSELNSSIRSGQTNFYLLNKSVHTLQDSYQSIYSTLFHTCQYRVALQSFVAP